MKQVVALSLDEEILVDLDDFSKKMGISRSAAANLVLKATLGGRMSDVTSLLKLMGSTAKKSRKKDGQKVAEA